MAENDHADSLPDLWLTPDKDLWRYGVEKDLLSSLDEAVSLFANFYVVDLRSEEHLASVAEHFNESVNGGTGRGILYYLVSSRDAVCYLKSLLQLGLDPDVREEFLGWSPSHRCGDRGWLDQAAVLTKCRPNLALKDHVGFTPLELAQRRASKAAGNETLERLARETALLWKRALERGFPSIAKLAAEKKFWALQNLLRRRVIPLEEKRTKHLEKTAAEWLQQYGEDKLLEEFEYFLEEPTDSAEACAVKVSKRTRRRHRAHLAKQADSREKLAHLEKRVEHLERENGRMRKELADLQEKHGSKIAEVQKDQQLLKARQTRVERTTAEKEEVYWATFRDFQGRFTMLANVVSFWFGSLGACGVSLNPQTGFTHQPRPGGTGLCGPYPGAPPAGVSQAGTLSSQDSLLDSQVSPEQLQPKLPEVPSHDLANIQTEESSAAGNQPTSLARAILESLAPQQRKQVLGDQLRKFMEDFPVPEKIERIVEVLLAGDHLEVSGMLEHQPEKLVNMVTFIATNMRD